MHAFDREARQIREATWSSSWPSAFPDSIGSSDSCISRLNRLARLLVYLRFDDEVALVDARSHFAGGGLLPR